MYNNSKGTYRQIIKATTIFGGVQIFSILISIIKSKIIAVLLGPAGMGIAGLFNSSISIISGLTSFGLQTSAVKNISVANATGKVEKISLVISVFRRLIWFTGALGLVTTIILSKQLSIIAFNTEEYQSSFVLISITLLLGQINAGQKVVLQGLRKLKHLAKSSIIGTLSGLVVSIPMYYFYGAKGIVPAIIFTSLFALFGSWYYSRKVDILNIKVNFEEFTAESKSMLKLGVILTLNGLMGLFVSYLFKIFISHKGGVSEVGLYNAGYSIINTYVGMIFAAMITDYFPRLSAVSNDNSESQKAIIQQAEITLLVLFPIICIFFIFIYWAVVLLFSLKFIAIEAMIHWAALGILFKAVSWSMGVVFAAKGHYKTLFWNELISNLYILGLNILGYHLYGLTGIGISFFISYFLHFFQIYLICKIKYGFNLTNSFLKLYLVILFFSIVCFLLARFSSPYIQYSIGLLIILFSIYFSFSELEKRLHIKEFFIEKIKKKL